MYKLNKDIEILDKMNDEGDPVLNNYNKRNIGRLIQIIGNRMRRRLTVDDEIEELTSMQKHIVGYVLFRHGGKAVCQRDIEEVFNIGKSSTTGIIQLIEKKGYLKRESMKEDARKKMLLPTEKALKFRNEINRSINYIEDELIKGISDNELEVTISVLTKMLDNISSIKK